ncbi:glyoxylase-like metal-dependent hydrolase (beta-lactamase superfamily II) [Neolewinella xylanilytica]|uniref:Glyoxylase-like metal-dependent hydrolase (Beta-lactamase superfamily II) n=1 Tax=Neolewinella xylanilytica TaxID=1514080 RepID=A0A2S6I4F9_9BACT|nr:MBL fold metallo-hydrolase [Neolewinella xylanilytica]PPK86065.1 glyoxylase-like metal-dependent hydrolase (beta-lactamase superfamily II) [Neolewinella xylanilytica]
MRRRRFLTTTTALAAGTLLRPLAARSSLFLPPAVTMIRDNVGFYTERGGTIGFYHPQNGVGGVVIDSQFPDAATNFLGQVFGNDAPLDLLINTHHHGDHTGGNGVIAPLARDYVSHERAHANLATSEAKRTEGEAVPLPKTTFAKEWSVELPGATETVTARHFGPAHTGGDAVIHFENANVAHLGDLLFNRRFPYVDPEAGGNLTNWIDVLGKIRKTYDRDTVFIFGHAAESYPVTGDVDDVASFRDYLRNLRSYVKKEKRKGTTLEQLKAKTTTIPNAPEWRFGDRLRDVNLEVMWGEV